MTVNLPIPRLPLLPRRMVDDLRRERARLREQLEAALGARGELRRICSSLDLQLATARHRLAERTVHVVDAVEGEPAVFAHEADAIAYATAGGARLGLDVAVYRLLVCDGDLARRMIQEAAGEDRCPACGAPDDGTQSYCGCGEALVDPKHMPPDVQAP